MAASSNIGSEVVETFAVMFWIELGQPCESQPVPDTASYWREEIL
jgi:hypothetical protein